MCINVRPPLIVSRLPQLPPRPADAHKGLFGRVLAVGGSAGMPGSIALVANGAYRAGAGLVRIFCPAAAQPIAAMLAPCATSFAAAETRSGRFSLAARSQLLEQAAQNDVLAVGPGMGRTPAGAQMIAAVLRDARKPAVIDADGLNNLAWLGQAAPRPAAPLVLTPHPGEMSRLIAALHLDVELSHTDESRRAAATVLAQRLGCIVALKGARTVVTDGARVYTNETGNPGLASGGAGDVLTGMIAALIGQQLEPFDATVLGVHLHGLAGDIGAQRLGQVSLMASDLPDTLPAAFQCHARAHPSGAAPS